VLLEISLFIISSPIRLVIESLKTPDPGGEMVTLLIAGFGKTPKTDSVSFLLFREVKILGSPKMVSPLLK
jgi:hypothetical protein